MQKRIKVKEKTNQYINETELKSLMIRINNKTFLNNLSKTFLRLDKYISKYSSTEHRNFKNILESYIIRTIKTIITSKSKQLLLMSDDELLNIKTLLNEYNAAYNDITLNNDYYIIKQQSFNNVLLSINNINTDMRIKNLLLKQKKINDSVRINKYIKKHSKSKSQKYKRILRRRIIDIAERNIIDKDAYERFGEMVLLIIKNILKKPKFSGYTYRDEFYSDSTDKIFRYLKNFNHKLISKITGHEVNAFSYLSQYVHNSILFIINTKNTEKQEVEKYVNTYNENIRLLYNETTYIKEEEPTIIELQNIKKSLYADILEETDKLTDIKKLKVIYPENYKISLEEYNKLTKLKDLLNVEVSVIRKRN